MVSPEYINALCELKALEKYVTYARRELDRGFEAELRADYEKSGVKSMDVKYDGLKVGTASMSFTKDKEVREFVVDDAGQFAAWLSKTIDVETLVYSIIGLQGGIGVLEEVVEALGLAKEVKGAGWCKYVIPGGVNPSRINFRADLEKVAEESFNLQAFTMWYLPHMTQPLYELELPEAAEDATDDTPEEGSE